MTFGTTWHDLLENVRELPANATLVTPLSRKALRVTDVQEPHILFSTVTRAKPVHYKKDQVYSILPAEIS